MKRGGKTRAVVCIACAVLAGALLCGCAPLYGRIGEMVESAVEVRDRERGGYEAVSAEAQDFAEEIGATAQGFTEICGDTWGEESAVMEGDSDFWGETDSLKPYELFGVAYDKGNGMYWFGGKPVAAIYDPGHLTMTDGLFMEVGALVVVERDAAGSITNVQAVDAADFASKSGVSGLDTTGRQRAAEMGYAFYEENASVKGLDQEQFSQLETELHAKYRNEDAVVQLTDYIFRFGRNDKLTLSAFCSSGANRYGVRVYADYDIADEIDLKTLDQDKTEQIIFDVLKAKQQETVQQVKEEVAQAIADAYGMDSKHIIVDVAKL